MFMYSCYFITRQFKKTSLRHRFIPTHMFSGCRSTPFFAHVKIKLIITTSVVKHQMVIAGDTLSIFLAQYPQDAPLTIFSRHRKG